VKISGVTECCVVDDEEEEEEKEEENIRTRNYGNDNLL